MAWRGSNWTALCGVLAAVGLAGCAGNGGTASSDGAGSGETRASTTVRASDERLGTDAALIAEEAVNVGDEAPGFALTASSGKRMTLEGMLEQGPVVLTWYRGGWCRYCTESLAAFEEHAGEIAAAGATLVAISPETLGSARRTKSGADVGFAVLSDPGNRVARAYGIAFRVDDATRERYVKDFGIVLPAYNGDDSWTLPLAVTYVIDREGVVRWAWVDADYRTRPEVERVVAALREL